MQLLVSHILGVALSRPAAGTGLVNTLCIASMPSAHTQPKRLLSAFQLLLQYIYLPVLGPSEGSTQHHLKA